LTDFLPGNPKSTAGPVGIDPPLTYNNNVHEAPYDERPLPRKGERLIFDKDGTAGIIVRDGAVAAMGRGGCALKLEDNIVAISHRIKLKGNLILLKGGTRLKGTLRSAERMKEIELRGNYAHFIGGQTLIGEGGRGNTFIEGRQILIGRGVDMIRIGDRQANIVVVGGLTQIFGRVQFYGIVDVRGVLTANGKLAKGHTIESYFPARAFPQSPKELPSEPDPEAGDDRIESVAAARMVP